MKTMFGELNKTSEDLFKDIFNFSTIFGENNYRIVKDGNDTVVALSLPGFKKEEVDITVEKEIITVKSKDDKIEDPYFKKSFINKFKYNDSIVDVDKIKAKMEDGVLYLRIAQNAEVKKESKTKINVD